MIADEVLAWVAHTDPITSSTEGLEDACFFCGADRRYSNGEDRWARHKMDCIWARATLELGIDMGRHEVQPWSDNVEAWAHRALQDILDPHDPPPAKTDDEIIAEVWTQALRPRRELYDLGSEALRPFAAAFAVFPDGHPPLGAFRAWQVPGEPWHVEPTS